MPDSLSGVGNAGESQCGNKQRSGGKPGTVRDYEPSKAPAFYPHFSHAAEFVADQFPKPATRGPMRKAL